MKTTKSKKTSKEQKQQMYAEKISRYVAMGLTYAEIGKLLDVSSRTIQRHISATELKNELVELAEPNTIQKTAFELSAKGLSYAQIAKRLRVTKNTIYNWHKQKKQNETRKT